MQENPVVELQKASSRREFRGLAIAALGALQRKGRVWFVHSESEPRRYRVRPYRKVPQCTCADHQNTGEPCKHILAVQTMIARSATPISDEDFEEIAEKIRKPTYPQPWAAYNAAKTNETREFQIMLAGLCELVESPPHVKGRPPIPLGDAIFAMAFKIYRGSSARKFNCDLEDAYERGYITQVPHFNSVLSYMRHPTVAPILRELIAATSRPFTALNEAYTEKTFAVDSTGFGMPMYGNWQSVKRTLSEKTKKKWLMAHLACGVKSNIVTAIEIYSPAGPDAADTLHLPDLIRRTMKTGFEIKEVCADKGYLSVKNHNFIDGIGAMPLMPFKKNSNAQGGHKRGLNDDVWKRCFHFFHADPEEFNRRYHQRSNVESTMWMLKKNFGHNLRSKSTNAQHSEIYCKVLCHNICCVIEAMHEFGMTPEFGITGSSEKRATPQPQNGVIQ